MAEENAAPEGGDEGAAAPEDVLVLDTPVEEPPTLEDVASELGWVPKDKFKGKEEDWKPAVDFIREGKNIQKGLAKDVKRLSSQMENMSRTSAAILQERIDAEKARLEVAHRKAVEDDDPDAALKIGKRIDQLDRQAQTTAGPTSDVQEWVQRNSWFTTNPLANAIAVQTAEAFARQGKGVAEQLQAAEDEVKRAYPHLFPTTKAPASVAQPGSRSASPTARAKGFSDMSREEQAIATDMVERGVIPNVDAYVKHRFASEGKSR